MSRANCTMFLEPINGGKTYKFTPFHSHCTSLTLALPVRSSRSTDSNPFSFLSATSWAWTFQNQNFSKNKPILQYLVLLCVVMVVLNEVCLVGNNNTWFWMRHHINDLQGSWFQWLSTCPEIKDNIIGYRINVVNETLNNIIINEVLQAKHSMSCNSNIFRCIESLVHALISDYLLNCPEFSAYLHGLLKKTIKIENHETSLKLLRNVIIFNANLVFNRNQGKF